MQAIFRKNLIMSFSLKSIHEFKTWNRYLLEQMKKKRTGDGLRQIQVELARIAAGIQGKTQLARLEVRAS